MSDTRQRVLGVERILSHTPKTAQQIMYELQRRYGITCDRKVIYQDIAVLTRYLPIVFTKKGYALMEVSNGE